MLTYADILTLLALAVMAFIATLRWVRTKAPGDYTVVKVAVGVALCLVAGYTAGLRDGVALVQMNRVMLWPFIVGGGLITFWQFVEWVDRNWEAWRVDIQEAVRKARRAR